MTKTILNDSRNNAVEALYLSQLQEDVFFPELSRHIKDLAGSDVEIYLSYNDESTRLISKNGKAIKDSKLLERGKGPSGYVAKTKRFYYSNNVSRDPVFASVKRNKNIQSELIVPVNVSGNVIATIHLQSNEDKKFSEKDALLISEFLKEAHVPLSNMNLYLMAKYLNKELLEKVKDQRDEDAGIKQEAQRVEMIGKDPAFLKSLSVASRVANQDIPVLIHGEVGVGKRLLGRKIHSLSERKHSGYQIIECASLNDESLEKDIFGCLERKGYLEIANNGTVLFNEIGLLSPKLQGKIFDFLTTGKINRVGGSEKINVNVRVLATSRKPLIEYVNEGKLREDLYYRLATVQIDLPKLKDRGEDIKLLANHFLNNNKSEKKFLTAQATGQLGIFPWEANVTELRNAMERTYALSEGKFVEQIEMAGFSKPEIKEEPKTREFVFEPISLSEIEKRHICKTLEFHNGNKTRAAKSLGVTVKTLYNKLHSYGLVTKNVQ